jgi:FkbM family methyltransferase
MLIQLSELKQKFGISPKSCLHIGASHGEEREAYHANGINTVIWVEAIPEVYEKLLYNIQDYSGHTAINACIHEVDRLELDFNVSSNEGQSSSIYQLGTHKEVHPDVSYIKTIRVKTQRADSIMWYAPDMVNLDIQGAELLALKSMSWLNNVKYIYTEVNEKELYKGCALVGDIDEYLKHFGFKRVITKMAGNTFWGDAFYMK